MNFNPTSARKLASLTALGAGALVVGMGEANATVVFSDFGGTPKTIGYSGGFGGSFAVTNASHGNVGFSFSKTGGGSGASTTQAWSLRIRGLNGLKMATNFGMLQLFSAGIKFTAAGATGSSAIAAFRARQRSYHSGTSGTYNTALMMSTGTVPPSTTYNNPRHSPDPFSDKFALFKFSSGGHSNYGWIELSLVNNSQSTNSGQGPDLNVISWAFDDSGSQLGAGDGVSPTVPEPGTFAMTGMGAMALGAMGIRRWRAAKTQA